MHRRPHDPNRVGIHAELCFAARAHALGLAVSRPYAHQRYDFLVDNGRRILRVQVKSATHRSRSRAYTVRLEWGRSRKGRARNTYSPELADVLAAHIPPAGAWYLLPIRLVGRRHSLAFFPDVPRTRSRWERFREAWELLT